MQSTLPKHFDLFANHNPFLFTGLSYPWNISSPTNRNNLLSHQEAQTKLDSIKTLIASYEDQNLFHPPETVPFVNLSKIRSPIFREELESLALENLNIVEKLIPVYVHATKSIEKVILSLYKRRILSRAKVHARIKENADFEIIVLADLDSDPRKTGPYSLIEHIYQGIQSIKAHNPAFKARRIREENVEEAFIELNVEDSKVIIRDYSERFAVSQRGLFRQEGESSFRTQFLTNCLLLFMKRKSLLPHKEGGFPQDLYPFMVREFIHLSETRLLDTLRLGDLDQVDEENQLWNEMLNFYQQSENLFAVLYSAQERLNCFKDCDFIRRNQDNSFSINLYDSYGLACHRLLEAFQPIPVPQENNIDETLTPEMLFD